MMKLKLKLLSTFLLVLVASEHACCATTKVTLNLDFTGFDGVTDCNKENEFITGTSLSVSLVEDDDNDDGGVVCEETDYSMDGEEWTAFTKVEITCTSAGVGKRYYDCKDSNDCSDCDDENPFQYAVATWDDVNNIDSDYCYSSTATVEDEDEDEDEDSNLNSSDETLDTIVVTSSWKFVKGSDEDDVTTFLNFYTDNSCIGDGIPDGTADDADSDADSDSDSDSDSSDDVCATIEEVFCGDEYPAEELTTLCNFYDALFPEPPSSPVTIFAPTNDSFDRLQELINVNDKDELDDIIVANILRFHSMDGAILYNELECKELHEMMNNEMSRTKCIKNEDGLIEKYQKGGGNRKNDLLPKIIVADILTCDGSIIHVVDEVMLPNYVDVIE